MVEFKASCPWHIQVEDLYIAPGRIPNCGTVWIGETESDKGREFKTKDLIKVLKQFYKDNS
jgi:hypothetical protein